MKKITSDILFGFLTKVTVRLRGLLFIPLISVNLGISAFGAYTQTLAIVTLLELVMCLGLQDSLTRYGRQTDDLSDLYFSLLVVATAFSLLTGLLFFSLAAPLARYTLGNAAYGEVYRLGAALIVIRTMIRLARNYFRVDARMKIFSSIHAVRVYAIAGTATASVLFFDGTLVDIFTWIVLVEAGIVVVLHGKIIREIGITLPSFTNLRKHLTYSIPITLSLLASNASSRVDRIVIGFFLGASAVGIYSMAYQIAIAIQMFMNPIRETFLPELSSLIDKGELQTCGTYIRRGVRYFLLLALPSAGGIFLIGPDVVSLLTAGRGTPSAALMLILALGMATNGTNQIYGVTLKAAEKTGVRAKIFGVGAVVNLLLNIALVPIFGIAGAAAVTLLTYLLMAGLSLREVERIVPTAFPVWSVIRCLGATAVMAAAMLLMTPNYLVSTILLSVVIYFGVLFLVRELTVEDIRLAL